MNPDELTETKSELEAFVEDVFASLPRADQHTVRAGKELYKERDSDSFPFLGQILRFGHGAHDSPESCSLLNWALKDLTLPDFTESAIY